LLTAALAALALPAAAGAWVKTTTLLPRVTYTKEVRLAYGAPLVTHVISAPRPGGLYTLRPVLSGGTALGLERISAMQHDLRPAATTAGVNGDFFNIYEGRPSGVFLRDGVLASRSLRQRSSLSIAFDGSLRVRRLTYSGTWQVDGFEAHRVKEFNRTLTDPPGVTLFTPTYGGSTPRRPRALDVVLSGLRPTVLNGRLRTRVAGFRWGGGTAVPRDGGILQARGPSRRVLLREARPGRTLTTRVRLAPFWTDVADAIGGGPVLVRGGRPVWQADEDFSWYQLAPRHPRTAVGQLSNGRVILVVVDGRSAISAGLRTWQLAQELVRLGAVKAMGLDGGGSSTMAFDGRVLNSPSDGVERSVADGLFVFYYGIYARRPAHRVVSPNGDGVLDVQHLSARVTRRSQVDVRLVRPDATVAWRFAGSAAHRRIAHDLSSAAQSGRWRWVAEGVDGLGRRSRMARSFVVNNTLGHLRLSKDVMRVYPRRGGTLGVSVVLARRARVSVAIRRLATGGVVRRLADGAQLDPGTLSFRWGGRSTSGHVVDAGRYRVEVRATNGIGTIGLRRTIRVQRS